MEADRLFRPPTEVADAHWHARRKQHDCLSRGQRRVLLQERSGNRHFKFPRDAHRPGSGVAAVVDRTQISESLLSGRAYAAGLWRDPMKQFSFQGFRADARVEASIEVTPTYFT